MKTIDIFKEVKTHITARKAAEHYGIPVKANGMCQCPFHNDKHPSMKVDEIYYCFACGATGDAIDFVGKLYGLSPLDAAKKLNDDFFLGIETEKPKQKKTRIPQKPKPTRQERANFVQKKLEEWLKYAMDVLIQYLKWLQFWKEYYKPKSMDEEWHPLFAEALDNEAKINACLDALMYGSGQDILDIFQHKRGDIKGYEERIKEYKRGVLAEFREYCLG